jgi:hypothetical protein
MKTTTHSHPGAGRIAQAVETIAAWLSGATRSRDDLAQCDPRDLESIARDVGLSAPELARAVAGSNGSTAELTRLLETLSLDARALSATEPAVMRDLARLCAGCSDKRRCGHELKAGVAAETYRDYCPNSYTIDALVAERKRTA